MDDKPLFTCWCVYFTKLRIYKNRVEIGQCFGISVTTIPIQKIASVSNSLIGIKIETTGGGKTEHIGPWDSNKKKEIVELILKLIDTH